MQEEQIRFLIEYKQIKVEIQNGNKKFGVLKISNEKFALYRLNGNKTKYIKTINPSVLSKLLGIPILKGGKKDECFEKTERDFIRKLHMGR